MERKKVESLSIKNDKPKKREETTENKKNIITTNNSGKIKWDKIKGVEGKIVRFKQSEDELRKEFLNKKKYKPLYVGIDGNDLYFYYEIFE